MTDLERAGDSDIKGLARGGDTEFRFGADIADLYRVGDTELPFGVGLRVAGVRFHPGDVLRCAPPSPTRFG